MTFIGTHRLLVLSNARDGRDEEFNAWYDEHLHHVLTVPGIDAAQRFRFSADQFPPEAIPPSDHTYLTIYEVSMRPAEVIPRLLSPELAEGLPDAFDILTERAWWYSAIGDRVGTPVQRPPHKLVVFSNPSSPELEGELNQWYDDHLHEVIELGAGVANAQRFCLSETQFPADVMPPSGHRYVALYDTTVPPAQTCGRLLAEMDGYEHPRSLDMSSLRDWMFTALGDRLAAPTHDAPASSGVGR